MAPGQAPFIIGMGRAFLGPLQVWQTDAQVSLHIARHLLRAREHRGAAVSLIAWFPEGKNAFEVLLDDHRVPLRCLPDLTVETILDSTAPHHDREPLADVPRLIDLHEDRRTGDA